MVRNILHFFLLLVLLEPAHSQDSIRHFIFFSQDRERIHESSFYEHPGIAGAQVTYTWKSLEPKKDKYDFSAIEEDMKFLQSKGKSLFIQIQDVTFYKKFICVPDYLLNDTIYHGGIAPDFHFPNDNEDSAIQAGWVARRWDPAVAERFHKLLVELGKNLDGKIEGINLPESSLEFGESGKHHPPGFTIENYYLAIRENMLVMKQAFPNSVTIQYLNFFPGGKTWLQKLYKEAQHNGVGVGGPDIKVWRWFQMENSYGLIRESHGIITTGMAVQDGNYSEINPKTKKQVTLPEILDFAQNYLRLNYVFWCIEEPFYTRDVLPMLRR
jgi:hypothetical protein